MEMLLSEIIKIINIICGILNNWILFQQAFILIF